MNYSQIYLATSAPAEQLCLLVNLYPSHLKHRRCGPVNILQQHSLIKLENKL